MPAMATAVATVSERISTPQGSRVGADRTLTNDPVRVRVVHHERGVTIRPPLSWANTRMVNGVR